MTKCIAPGAASWRGQVIEIAPDGSCDIPDKALEELRAHGFCEWSDAETGASKPGGMSRKETFDWLKSRGVDAPFNTTTAQLRALVLEAQETGHGND